MQSKTQVKLQKLQRISNILRTVCKVLYVLIGIQFAAMAVMLLVGRDGAITGFNVSFPIAGVAIHLRIVLLALCALTSAVVIRGVYYLQRLFDNYSRGEIFTRDAVAQLRQVGVTYLLWAGVDVLWICLPLAVVAHGAKPYALNLDSVSIGVILLVVAWFMDMAVEIREENELTI